MFRQISYLRSTGPHGGMSSDSQDPPSDDDTEERIKQVKVELLAKGWVEELEFKHCVHIQLDAFDLACSIVGRYHDDTLLRGPREHKFTPHTEFMKVEVLRLLEKACLGLRDDFNEDAELTHLDWEEYLLLRNLVELHEVTKEKTQSSSNYLSRILEEYKVLRGSWVQFVENCKAILKWQQSPKRMAQLVKIRERMCQVSSSEVGRDNLVHVVQEVLDLVNVYRDSIPASIMQYLTVSSHTVAKVATRVTGVPTSWLLNSFQPPLDGLRDRLARRVIGQDHIIKGITNILSKPWPQEAGPSPLASFLFLRGALGVMQLAESLVEELYDSKDRLIRFDLSEYSDYPYAMDGDLRDCTSRKHSESSDKKNAIVEKLVEAVKSTCFCGILFENVERGSKDVIGFLDGLVRQGRLSDGQGNTYELTNTLILFTSNMGMNESRPISCKCLNMDLSMRKAALTSMFSKDHECSLVPVFREALTTFENKFSGVDDILVFNYVSPLDREVITRMWLREVIDASWKVHRLVLYPSEAVVRVVASWWANLVEMGDLKSWLHYRVMPDVVHEVNRMTATNTRIIYIDVPVGTRTLSYRSEEIDNAQNGALKALKEFLNQWRTLYQKEKSSVDEIDKLRERTSSLLYLILDMDLQNKVMMSFQASKNVLDGVIANAINSSNLVFRHCSLPLVVIDEELTNCIRMTKRAETSKMDGLRLVLYGNTESKYSAVDFIIGSMSISFSYVAKSFLLLGLTDTGKAELVNALRASESDTLIRHLNMEGYCTSDSLELFLDDVCKPSLDQSFPRHLRFSNFCHRILVLDRVGAAHISVFSALLSLLDRAVLKNRDGQLVDFSDTVVIIMSDSGNTEMFAQLAGHVGGSTEGCKVNQRRERPFRHELLYQVDEILIFNPLLEAQLQKFFRLPTEVGWHYDLRSIFSFLFKNYGSKRNSHCQQNHITACNLLKLSVGNRGDAVFANRRLSPRSFLVA